MGLYNGSEHWILRILKLYLDLSDEVLQPIAYSIAQTIRDIIDAVDSEN